MQNNADIRHAVYLTVQEYPARRGLNPVQSAAATIGRAAGTVYNKASPENDDQAFTIEEMVSLMVTAQDFRVLHAISAACDHVAVDIKPLRQWCDSELLKCLLREQDAVGDKANTILSALEDGRVDPVELQAISVAVYQQVRCTLELLSRLEGMADAQPRR